ncbi:MAG: diaminopimelate epimerase [Novosphingobium sp.]
MQVAFTKMHGLGNDFVVIDGRETPVAMRPALAAALADRHTGIGCDQLIVLVPSTVGDLGMRIFNADGGEVESCGNASRAVGLLLGRAARIETLGGLVVTEPAGRGIAVDMGRPRWEWQDIPLAYAMDTLHLPVAWDELEDPCAVNVGNPHVVFFVPDCDAVRLDRLGPLIEHDPLFPERVNVNVATIVGGEAIRLRVWERGAGLTRACGTGACATAVAAIRRGLVSREVSVRLPGGALTIAWPMAGAVRMTGPAAETFRGTFDLEAFRVAA